MPRVGSSNNRGYDADHRRLRAQWLPQVMAGNTNCAKCGQRIHPRTTRDWDLGHTTDRTAYTGPEHIHCNRSAGAAHGNRHRSRPPRPWHSRNW